MVIWLEDSETPTNRERPETSAVPDEKKHIPKNLQLRSSCHYNLDLAHFFQLNRIM